MEFLCLVWTILMTFGPGVLYHYINIYLYEKNER